MKTKLSITTALLLFINFLYAQRDIQGEVSDMITGAALNKVDVVLNNNKRSTQTNKKGKFELEVLKNTDTLYFKAKGYNPTYVVVGNIKKFKVLLVPENAEKKIDLGYVSASNESNTSSVMVLEEENFNKGVVTNIYDYLRGKVPGLQLIQNGVNPGDKPQVVIRGGGSLANRMEPLILVNGVQNVSLDSVDPYDISSITVLKDGSATALYGSQANGGVILIKTKK